MTPKKLLTRLALPLAAAPLAACATAGAPTAQEPDAPPSARVEVVLEDAPAPTEVARTADHSTYVVWVQDGDGDGPRRLGAMDYDAERDLAAIVVRRHRQCTTLCLALVQFPTILMQRNTTRRFSITRYVL